eukprot:TRINITY_DN13402_c0_g1_i2.p1 TRINITY_DN13402_c0_g1~~TRINITY_DN13402_c0_g1_i2.p1  ORF type:complete len:197 (+),score=34.41 TRINITY_DN13402_c0_g1_i2:26-592(+)
MEPIPLFDGPNPSRATWVQGEETVTITVPLPEASSSLEVHRPTVSIRPRRLCVTTSIACCDSSRTGEAAGESSGAPEQTTLLDNELSGEVSVEDSTWTFGEGLLVIELAKKSDFAAAAPHSGRGAQGRGSQGEPRPAWWPCAVCAGKSGPPDPKAPKKMEPNIQKLDSKIGEQAVGKKNFEGKSKFQW